RLPLSSLFPYTTLFRSGSSRCVLARVGESGNGPVRSRVGKSRRKRGDSGHPSFFSPSICVILQSMRPSTIHLLWAEIVGYDSGRSEEHTSELQSPCNLV